MSAAVTTGLFALGGVIVGGVFNGAVAVFIERRKTQIEMRAAARLLADNSEASGAC